MEQPRNIDVCTGCHHNLHVTASASVTSTGEFALSDVDALTKQTKHEFVPQRTTVTCTWCSRDETQARKLLSHGNAHICNACVGLCADILQAELGDNWAD